MGVCTSKKKVCHPSRQLTNDLDDELRQKQKHLDLFKTYTSKGDDFLLKKDHANAASFYEKAFDEIIQVDLDYKDCTFPLSSLYQRLALLFNQKKEYSEALEFQKKAAEIRENRLPKHDALVAGAYSSLGLAYQDTGDYDTALEYYTRALEGRIQVFGENHWVTAGSYERLAMLESAKGNYNEAIELINRAHRTRQGSFGENNSDIAYNVRLRGDIYYSEGKYDEAVACYGLAMDKFEKLEEVVCDMVDETGRNMMHGEVVKTFEEQGLWVKYEMVEVGGKLGCCYVRMGKKSEGETAIEKALGIAREIFGPEAGKEVEEEMKRVWEEIEGKEGELETESIV